MLCRASLGGCVAARTSGPRPVDLQHHRTFGRFNVWGFGWGPFKGDHRDVDRVGWGLSGFRV